MPAKKVSRVMDVQKNNQLKYNFTGVPETDPRACFNRATWSPAVNLQQPTTRDISPDIGRQLSPSANEFEDLMGHHGDGLWKARQLPNYTGWWS